MINITDVLFQFDKIAKRGYYFHIFAIGRGKTLISKYEWRFKQGAIRKYAISFLIVLLIISLTAFVCSRRKTVTVFADGSQMQFVTYESTVENALEARDISIGQKDKIYPALDSKLSDQEQITIKRALNIQVAVDGKTLELKSAETNIASLLKAEGITLNSEDKVKPGKETLLTEGLKIEVIRVETKILTENLPIPYKEVVKSNKKLPNTSRKVIQEGKNGEKQVATSIIYENGKEVSRTIANETILKPPTDKIIEQGTKLVMPVTASGSIMNYSKVFTAKATAYWAVNGVSRTYTASGRKAVRDTGGYSTIAVDPKVISYGTKLFVEGYGFAIAADTGSAIKGNIIDVYFNTYKEACSWGVRYVKVYILK